MNSDLEKYVRMLRVGVPERGVRECMVHDGVPIERLEEDLARAQRLRRGYLMVRDAYQDAALLARNQAKVRVDVDAQQPEKRVGIAGAVARWARSLGSRMGIRADERK